MMDRNELIAAIECILFVAGDPVPLIQLQRTLEITDLEMQPLLQEMQDAYAKENRGIALFVTEETIQLVSNKKYAKYVEEFLQPAQSKNFSQAMMETLSIIAYKQPVTRSDIEAVRGVRCEYSVSQLLKQGLIQELGRKDVIGRPMLFGTTDAFLRKFGLHSLEELPHFQSAQENESSAEELIV